MNVYIMVEKKIVVVKMSTDSEGYIMAEKRKSKKNRKKYKKVW